MSEFNRYNSLDYKKYYENDEYINNYDNKFGEGRIENLIKFIEFNYNDIVLDIGCGNGMLFDLIKDKIKLYVGLDISKKFIKKCKKRFKKEKNIKLYNESAQEHKKQKFKYDKIFLFDVTEHIPDKDLIEILRSIKPMLKKNGVFYVHTPNKDYFLEIMKNKGTLKQVYGHIAVRNFVEYDNLLKISGFKSFSVCYLPHYNWLKYFHFLSFLPIIGKYFKARLFIKINN